MNNEKEVIDFLEEFSSTINTLDDCINFCRNHRNSDNVEIVVISSALLAIFYEMIDYLDYFESEIEKKFGGVTIREWERIRDSVFAALLETMKEKDHLNEHAARLELIADVVSSWENLHKEDAEKILRSLKRSK